MALVVLAHSDGVVVSDTEFREIVTDLDMYRSRFEALLRTVMLAYGAAARSHDSIESFRSIEHWIHDNYIDIRETLPPELKRLYLQEIAFPRK